MTAPATLTPYQLALLEKFPPSDPRWSDAVQEKWLCAFARLLDILGDQWSEQTHDAQAQRANWDHRLVDMATLANPPKLQQFPGGEAVRAGIERHTWPMGTPDAYTREGGPMEWKRTTAPYSGIPPALAQAATGLVRIEIHEGAGVGPAPQRGGPDGDHDDT